MAEHKSDQVANTDSVPMVMNKPNVSHGNVRRQAFSYTVPAGDAAVADTIVLARVPLGSRIYGGVIAHEAMSSGAGDAGLQIGDGTTAAKYLGTTTVDAAGVITFGDTVALNFMEALTGELSVIATVTGEALLAGQTIKGYVEYMLD